MTPDSHHGDSMQRFRRDAALLLDPELEPPTGPMGDGIALIEGGSGRPDYRRDTASPSLRLPFQEGSLPHSQDALLRPSKHPPFLQATRLPAPPDLSAFNGAVESIRRAHEQQTHDLTAIRASMQSVGPRGYIPTVRRCFHAAVETAHGEPCRTDNRAENSRMPATSHTQFLLQRSHRLRRRQQHARASRLDTPIHNWGDTSRSRVGRNRSSPNLRIQLRRQVLPWFACAARGPPKNDRPRLEPGLHFPSLSDCCEGYRQNRGGGGGGSSDDSVT